MAIHLLHGDAKSTDPYLIKKRLDELLEGISREGNLNFSTFDLSESGASFPEVVSSALTVPFLGGQRTVVARGVKAVESAFRTEDDEESGKPKKREYSGSAEAILRAVEQLKELPRDALLILVEETGHLDGRTAFYRALKKLEKDKRCKIETFKAMWFDPAAGDIRSAVQFIQAEASKLGLRLSAELAERFALLVGSDRGTILRELEKLALYAGTGSRLTEEDIESVVTPSYEAGIFQLVDELGYGHTGKALKRLDDLLDRGAAPPYILAMIARQVRLIARVREAMESGVPAEKDAMAKALKESPFVTGKVITQVRQFGRFDYPTVLERLMETDLHLKRGTMQPKLALETLITRLRPAAHRH